MPSVADTINKVFRRAVVETKRVPRPVVASAAIYFTMSAFTGGGGLLNGFSGQAATTAKGALKLKPGGLLDKILTIALDHTGLALPTAALGTLRRR